MKSIENLAVFNTWALLVDFLNEHSWLHPRKSSLVLSWSAGASATRTMKAQDTKRAFKPNFPAIRPKARFFKQQQIWDQNAPNSTKISKIIGF